MRTSAIRTAFQIVLVLDMSRGYDGSNWAKFAFIYFFCGICREYICVLPNNLEERSTRFRFGPRVRAAKSVEILGQMMKKAVLCFKYTNKKNRKKTMNITEISCMFLVYYMWNIIFKKFLFSFVRNSDMCKTYGAFYTPTRQCVKFLCIFEN